MTPQDGRKIAQDAPKTAQDSLRLKMPPSCPKSPPNFQDCPKRAWSPGGKMACDSCLSADIEHHDQPPKQKTFSRKTKGLAAVA